MTPAHRTPRIDITGRCLVLGRSPAPGVDVLLIDLTGVDATAVPGLVAGAESRHPGGIGISGGTPPAVGAALAAGVGLVVLDLDDTSAVEVAAVVESGVVAVLHHREPARAVGAVDALVRAGIDTARVVVEVGPGDEIVEEVMVLERSAFGFGVGAVVAPSAAATWSEAARHGWEIGTLTALLEAGIVTVRGPEPERVRRVAAVLDTLDLAATASTAPLSGVSR